MERKLAAQMTANTGKRKEKAVDYHAVLADLRVKRQQVDDAIAGIQMLKALQQPVCIVDVSRCPTLIAALDEHQPRT